MTIAVNVTSRDNQTKSELRKLRDSGKVPASVSGKKITPVSIAVDEKELLALLRSHPSEILEMDVPGQGKQSVMLKELQRDKVQGGKLLHVDFQQISMTDPVKTTVRIELEGVPVGIEGGGGILQQMLAELEIKALPRDLPTAIHADVSGLALGDKITVEDLGMPPGVECLSDPTSLVATILQVRQTTDAEQEEMASEAEGKGGLKDTSDLKLSDRPNAEDAAEETAGV